MTRLAAAVAIVSGMYVIWYGYSVDNRASYFVGEPFFPPKTYLTFGLTLLLVSIGLIVGAMYAAGSQNQVMPVQQLKP